MLLKYFLYFTEQERPWLERPGSKRGTLDKDYKPKLRGKSYHNNIM